jgi:hypothetical protein
MPADLRHIIQEKLQRDEAAKLGVCGLIHNAMPPRPRFSVMQ